MVAHQSIVEVYFSDGDGKIDAEGKGSGAGEQAEEHEQAAKEFGESRNVCAPGGQSQAGNELNVVMQPTEN